MTEDLTTFMLTSITGIAKEKRKSGTDSETITERTKCLLNTTGIEPLCGELSEILSRSFVINFDLANQASDCFLESEVISAIQQNRDLIISAIMKRTSHVLAMIRDGAQKQVMRLLHRTMPTHGKRRCNDYLSLMYLMMLAGSEEHEVTSGLEDLSPLFIEQIHSINDTSQEMARESNPIATALASLFHAYRNAVELDEKARYGEDDRANHVVGFIERYQVRFENENTMEPVVGGTAARGAAQGRPGIQPRIRIQEARPARSAHQQRPGRHPGRRVRHRPAAQRPHQELRVPDCQDRQFLISPTLPKSSRTLSGVLFFCGGAVNTAVPCGG